MFFVCRYVILCYQAVSPSSLKNFPVAPSLSSVAYFTITLAPCSKVFVPEHHMAAKRMGFFDFFEPLYKVSRLSTGILDGSL